MRITAYPLHLSSWNFTGTLLMSQGWALFTSGSNGQRSRSQCIDYWKWLISHNCFPFTPIIMKLHTKTPLEWRVCPMGVRVKRSKVKVTKAVSTVFGGPLHLQSSDFTHRFPVSQGYALLILGLKCGECELVAAGGICPIRTAPF